MGNVIFVNKHNLKIARENVGISVSYASKRVANSAKSNVALWESGDALPTWVQIKNLAKLYSVSELVLMSKRGIQENRNIPDFRVGLDLEEKSEVKKLVDLVLKRQSWLEKTFKKDGHGKNKLLGSGDHIKSPGELAKYISKSLNVDLNKIKMMSGRDSRKQALNYLIEKAEAKRIFVGKTIAHHKISVKQMRGLFVSNDYCPFIVLNRKDAVSAQIFSFVHELSHFFRRSDSISNSIDFRDINGSLDPEETFCNKVAVNLLLPSSEFKKDDYDLKDIENLAEEYKISKLFVFYRLKDLGKITRSNSGKFGKFLKEESEVNIKAKNDKKQEGGNYYYNMRDSNGDLFNRVVLNSYLRNNIDYIEASSLLKFSVENYEH